MRDVRGRLRAWRAEGPPRCSLRAARRERPAPTLHHETGAGAGAARSRARRDAVAVDPASCSRRFVGRAATHSQGIGHTAFASGPRGREGPKPELAPIPGAGRFAAPPADLANVAARRAPGAAIARLDRFPPSPAMATRDRRRSPRKGSGALLKALRTQRARLLSDAGRAGLLFVTGLAPSNEGPPRAPGRPAKTLKKVAREACGREARHDVFDGTFTADVLETA